MCAEGPQAQGAVLLCHGVGGAKGERDSKERVGALLAVSLQNVWRVQRAWFWLQRRRVEVGC
jgi:hypothetical protein